jgi:hypothetical protein
MCLTLPRITRTAAGGTLVVDEGPSRRGASCFAAAAGSCGEALFGGRLGRGRVPRVRRDPAGWVCDVARRRDANRATRSTGTTATPRHRHRPHSDRGDHHDSAGRLAGRRPGGELVPAGRIRAVPVHRQLPLPDGYSMPGRSARPAGSIGQLRQAVRRHVRDGRRRLV